APRPDGPLTHFASPRGEKYSLVQHLYIFQDDTVECDEGNESDNNGSTMYADQFGGDCDVARFMMTQSNIITDMDPLLICPEAGPHPKPFPHSESHVGMIGNSTRPSDDNWFDTTAQYHGAFSPHPMGPNRNWIKEWANFLRPNDIESILAGLVP
ncbi:MAG: hypothetical protein OXI93_09485, partial [Bryobacterales bacterium]|nr:hypothetical protein [Bryobacterales bacterium]